MIYDTVNNIFKKVNNIEFKPRQSSKLDSNKSKLPIDLSGPRGHYITN